MPRPFRVVPLILVSFLSSPVLRADTYPRQAGVDVLHYVFRLTLRDDTDAIAGEATVQVRARTAGLLEVSLDLAGETDGKGMKVSSVEAAGKPLAYRHEANRLTVTLAEAATAGQEFAIDVRYGGRPAGGLYVGPNIFGARTFFSENWPDQARQWLPMVDHPYEKSTGEFLVTAPAHYQVVANGLLVAERDLTEGRRLTHWRQSVPIVSWLYALGVARFAVHHAGEVKGVPHQTWVFPEHQDEVAPAFESTGRGQLEFLSERVGPFAYEKLAHVEAASLKGGTEHASAIFYGETSVTGHPIVGLVAHEVAHQWFGDAVTESDWDDVWLSEGFATYFQKLYTEHAQGRDAFVAEMKASRETVFVLTGKYPDKPVIHPNLDDMTQVLNGLVYDKAGWTLHMLRGLVGDDAFWRGIREYYRRFKDRHVRTDDFQQVMEEASGLALRPFFDQWLRRSGVPRIEGSWRYDRAQKQIVVELAQTQPGEPYRLPIDIGIGGLPTARVEHVLLEQVRATFRFAATEEPTAVMVDPSTWLLAELPPLRRTR